MSGTIRVVVVDDVKDIRGLLRMNLEFDERFEVVGEAADGAEAIALARDLQPDAMILDLSMPFTSGLDAIPEIRRLAPRTKILVLSAHDERRRVKAMDDGKTIYEFKGNDLIARITAGLIKLCAPSPV